MKYALLTCLSLFLTFCRKPEHLPEQGIWVNYKYPLYLHDMRSARFVQNQIYITAVEFKPGDPFVWVQFRLRDRQAYRPVFLGNKKWRLQKDSADCGIQLELTADENTLFVAHEMFHRESEPGTAYRFYADTYRHGNKMVYLKPDGAVVGLDSFIRFRPVTDYSEEPGTGDRIYLQSASGVWVKFGLAITDWGSLKIYPIGPKSQQHKPYLLIRQLKPLVFD